MKNLLHLFLICLILGCESDSHPTEKETETETTHVNGIHHDSSISTHRIDPSTMFINFIKQIESKNWVSDTARVNKVGLYNLREAAIQSFEDRPFYELKYDQTLVHKSLQYDPSEEEREADRVFSRASQIWGYFYRDKNGRRTISDGMIEEWTYRNTDEANEAYRYFQKYGDNIFFNTMPFFHQQKEKIYIFHTRAMLFSYEQKPLFEEFLKVLASDEI